MAPAARRRVGEGGRMRSSATALAVFAVMGFECQRTEALFPSIGADVYKEGQTLPLYVNELTSTRTQSPMDHYHVGYCKPKNLHENTENIGAYLEGDREENSLYDLRVMENKRCSVLCAKKLSPPERYMFGKIIIDDYMAHMTVDDLPAAYKLDQEKVEQSAGSDTEEEQFFVNGYPIGIVDSEGHTFLNNHLTITVAVNARDEEKSAFHIVGFMVKPSSIQHDYQEPWVEGLKITTCGGYGYMKSDAAKLLSTNYEGEVLFTYDVFWETTDLLWTQRWDIFSNGLADNQIHWFSITNSSVIVLFLTVLVAMIMVRALRKDIQRYNAEDMEEANEETGWKLVHGDVLRPPTTMPMLFAVCVGTGVQLWSVCFLLLCVSMMRLVSPLKRGGMLTVFILMYVLTGGIAGYHSAKIHRRFRGTEWLKMTIFTGLAFPVMSGAIFLIEAFQQWLVDSTGAVPPLIMMELVAMLLLVHMPLVFVGSFYGFKKQQPPAVVRTNQIPRMIPQTPWYVDPKVAVPFAGVLPFGAVLVELVFVMTALWEKQPYFIFGFLMSVMLILTITCAEISIVMCYFQLCSEDYRWWWRSMLWSGSCAGWMLIYSVGYYFTALELEGWMAMSLFFGYTSLMSASFFLLSGTVGYFSCQWFINIIYSSIKVD